MGALEILLGLRQTSGSDMLRQGAIEARISGLFELNNQSLAKEVSHAADQNIVPGDPFLVTRKLFASGRSSASINGQPVTATMVRAIGELLVDVHGRQDHQYLLKPSNQLLILDEFGQSTALRHQYRDLYTQLRLLKKQRDDGVQSKALNHQQLELYEFQAKEIDSVSPVLGEYRQLQAKHTRLSNLHRIKREAGAAHGALHDSENSILERLHMVSQVLTQLVELDDCLQETAQHIQANVLSLQDGAYELGRYAQRIELDSGELESVEDRLNALNRLLAKYASNTPIPLARIADQATSDPNDDPLLALLTHRETIGKQIEQLRDTQQSETDIQAQINAKHAKLLIVGDKLSRSRRDAANKLKPLVESQLQDLGMVRVAFEVAFDHKESSSDAVVDGPTGLDRVEMLVRTNVGQPARPLRKIASSGELSRIMLALKSILSDRDRTSVLVFDEIDANIGGRLGTVIGTKLRCLAKGKTEASVPSPGHQVLCITHLPQIAAFADRHLHIAKRIKGKGQSQKTVTTVSVLEGSSRVNELAEMLAGNAVTPTTRRQVRELLQMAVTT